MELPFTGIVDDTKCQGLRINNKLYTQCKKNKTNGDYCTVCANQIKKNGTTTAGTISDRLKVNLLDYIDPKGNKVQPYILYMKKHGYNKTHVINYAKSIGITVDEIHFNDAMKPKLGRPKKNMKDKPKDNIVLRDFNDKKRLGRPSKEKKVIISYPAYELCYDTEEEIEEDYDYIYGK